MDYHRTCTLCEKKVKENDIVLISRCCCDSDAICIGCVETASLKTYIQICVTKEQKPKAEKVRKVQDIG